MQFNAIERKVAAVISFLSSGSPLTSSFRYALSKDTWMSFADTGLGHPNVVQIKLIYYRFHLCQNVC